MISQVTIHFKFLVMVSGLLFVALFFVFFFCHVKYVYFKMHKYKISLQNKQTNLLTYIALRKKIQSVQSILDASLSTSCGVGWAASSVYR